ncbi:hypothetical protein [Streptomyces mirabilis]
MTQPTDNRRVPGRRPRLLDLFCCQGGAALAMLVPVLGVAA